MAQRLKDMAGMTFGKLKVIGLSEEKHADGTPQWHCECECGQTKEVKGGYLRSGLVKSCGCLYRETRRTASYKDGTSSHPLYSTWANIRTRTGNPNNRQWSSYGGRGIKLHEAWQDAATFLAWVDENLGERPAGETLDRINNDGHYEPGNLKWSTKLEQNTNQRPRVRNDQLAAANAEVAYLREQLAALGWVDPR